MIKCINVLQNYMQLYLLFLDVSTVVDRCAYNNGGCSSLATCTNTQYGRKCKCRKGYTGTGVTCSGKISLLLQVSIYSHATNYH